MELSGINTVTIGFMYQGMKLPAALNTHSTIVVCQLAGMGRGKRKTRGCQSIGRLLTVFSG